MKKFLIRLLIFLSIGFLSQFLIFTALKKMLDAKSQFRITRYFRSPKHKYFVLGNSRAVNSVSEKYANDNLKLDLINLSFNGEPYKNVVNMLDDINSKNKNVIILFEISCISNSSFDYSYAYYISNSQIIKNQFRGDIYTKLQLLRLNNEIFLRNIYYLKNSDNNWINNNVITPNIINHIKSDTTINIFSQKKLCYDRVTEIEKKCALNHNKLIFFLAPYYPDYLSKVADYDSVVSYMNSNSRKFNFIDLNKIKLESDKFADRLHTNEKGAVELTNTLLNLNNLN